MTMPRVAIVTVVLAIVGCMDRSAVSPPLNGLVSSSGVTVTATEPDSATQDTTLDVVVTGSNFEPGSAAQWAISGVAASRVHTNSTRFVSSKRLIANITIAADADPVLYDVLVTTPGGKKGIGTELFAIKQRATDTPVTVLFRDAATDGILSDAQIRTGDPTYIDGVESVGARITGVGGYLSLDVRTQTPRKVCLDFHGQTGAPYATVCDDGYATTSTGDPQLLGMAVGTTTTTRFGVVWVKDGYNWSLKFGKDCDENILPDRRASVTRVDGSTWRIDSPPMRAFLCRVSVKGKPVAPLVGEFFMPMQLEVRLQ